MPRLRGLPNTKKMRHDAHFVDRLSARPGDSLGRQIEVSQIDPNPNQPRRTFTGIDELVASIQEKGVLEPLLVRAKGERFEIIAGERRFRAAQQAGLSRVPCIEIDVDDRGCLEISLVENIQRRDLTAFEEADALVQLREEFGYTQKDIARKLGRSRSTITETMTLAVIPEDVRSACTDLGITSRSTLLQIARLPDEKSMLEIVRSLEGEDHRREDLRDLRRGEAAGSGTGEPAEARETRPGFTFRFKAPDRPYTFTLRFPEREKVQKRDMIRALEQIIQDLRQSK